LDSSNVIKQYRRSIHHPNGISSQNYRSSNALNDKAFGVARGTTFGATSIVEGNIP